MMDDTEYVPFIKAAINGIEAHAISLHMDSQNIVDLKDELKAYSRALYVESWLENGEEGEDKEIAKVEGMEYFNYVYRHDEHPY